MKKLALALTLVSLLAPAATHAQNAYITNAASNTVSVIDTTTDTVIATIPVGFAPFGVAVSPDGSAVYVTNLNQHVDAWREKRIAPPPPSISWIAPYAGLRKS